MITCDEIIDAEETNFNEKNIKQKLVTHKISIFFLFFCQLPLYYW